MSEELFIRLLNWFYYGYASGFIINGVYFHRFRKLSWKFPWRETKYFTTKERLIIKQFLKRIKINNEPLFQTSHPPFKILYKNYKDLENCLIMEYQILTRTSFDRKKINNNLKLN